MNDLGCRIPLEVGSSKGAGVASRPFRQTSTLAFIQPRTNLVGIDQFSAMGGGVTLLDFYADLAAMLGQPSFLLVEQGNGVFHKLIHGLVRPALNVPLDHFFQLR